jgi:hypothetical protein
MPLVIGDRAIQRIAIVDDDQKVREGYEYPVQELELTALPEVGPLPGLDAFIPGIQARADAAICDHHLRVKSYAPFDGAELVARCYRAFMPALLCTKWEDASLDEIRAVRRYIPVLLKPSELEPDSIKAGFVCCVEEFNGQFQPNRRSWRTLIRVEAVDSDGPRNDLYVVVPAWSPDAVIRLRKGDLSPEVQRAVEPGARLHAGVNLGAGHQSELYFEAWEVE